MKVLLLGITGAGKSTLAPYIAEYFGLKLIEADDEVKKQNNGVWPKDERVIDNFFEIANSEILKKDNVLYVISWLEKDRILEFSEAGFIITELHADTKTLIARKQKRDNPDTKELKRFEKNVEGYYEVTKNPTIKPLFTISLDTTSTTTGNVKNEVRDKLAYKQLTNIITQIHKNCFTLCKLAIDKYLPIAGNIGIFCQKETEYSWLIKLKATITKPSENDFQKYFELKTPIELPSVDEFPKALYSYLYIRKPDTSAYGKNRGDIDFVLSEIEYSTFRESVRRNEIPYAKVYERVGWDTVEVTKADISSVAYISTSAFAEKVRVKFD